LPLSECITNESFIAEPYIFYIQSDRIFAYSVVECMSRPIINIREHIGTGTIAYKKFDFRPKDRKASKVYKFLLLCSLYTGKEVCLAISFNMIDEILTQPIKQFPASDACFFGLEDSLLILNPDRQHLTTFIFSEDKELIKENMIDKKVRSIYSTPLDKGRTILYQLHKKHKLGFLQNKETWELNNSIVKLEDNEICVDVNWQNENTCAIITDQRIIIADSNLELVWKYKLNEFELSSTVISSWWLGNTLLFNNCTHIYYLVPYHSPCAIISLPEPRVLVGGLLDRVFTFQGDKTSNIKILPLTLTEALIIGYLQSQAVTEEVKEQVKNLLEKLDTNFISKNLIEALNKSGMNSLASELVNKSSYAQFTDVDRIVQAMKYNEQKVAIEFMTRIKDLKNPLEHLVIESMLKYYTNPIYKFEATQIENILHTAIGSGNYKIAYLCAQLLNDQVMGRRLVVGSESEKKFINGLMPELNKGESMMRTDLECIISAEKQSKTRITHEEKAVKNWKAKPQLIDDTVKVNSSRMHFTGIKAEQSAIPYVVHLTSSVNSIFTKTLPTIGRSSLRESLGYDVKINRPSSAKPKTK